jgi:hypothetical protein
MLVNEGRQPLPSKPGIDGEPAVYLPFVLCVHTCFRPPRVVSRTRYRKVGSVRKSQQQIPERAAREFALIEGEEPVVIGRGFNFRHGKPYPANVHSRANGVLAFDIGKVVRYLIGAGQRGAHMISAYRSKARPIGEVNAREPPVGWVV